MADVQLAVNELGALAASLGRTSVSSAQVALALGGGRMPNLLETIRAKVGLPQNVEPSPRDVGTALRLLANATGLLEGYRGGHAKAASWRPTEAGKGVAAEAPPKGVEAPKAANVEGVPVPPAEPPDPLKDPTLHAHGAPDGFHLRGVSTLLDGAGQPVMQWVKTAKDAESQRLEMLFEAIKSLPESFREAHEPVKAPEHCNDDLLCCYPLGDPHLGEHAWAEETGGDYDLKIASRLHVEAIRKLVALSPPAKQALIISLGDFFHADSNLARTERSGAPLDTDSRWAKVLKVGIHTMKAMIDLALEKHESVRLVVEVGNHDSYSSTMLALAIDAFYDNDPRVTVDTSPQKFHWYRFGRNLIGTTHGDSAKPDQLPMIMAHDKAEDWGQTRFRRWYVGHIHQERVREFPGCTVEWFRTLAGRDAWAHGSGYRSDRDMRVDVLHREHGMVTRHIVGIEQLN
jgi:hypothetical protein